MAVMTVSLKTMRSIMRMMLLMGKSELKEGEEKVIKVGNEAIMVAKC